MTENITLRILKFVKANPGTTHQDIRKAMPEIKSGTVSNMLGRLQKQGAIENRGGTVNRWNPAKWYPVVDHSISDRFRGIARGLLRDLKDVHPSKREDYLAKQLQGMFE